MHANVKYVWNISMFPQYFTTHAPQTTQATLKLNYSLNSSAKLFIPNSVVHNTILPNTLVLDPRVNDFFPTQENPSARNYISNYNIYGNSLLDPCVVVFIQTHTLSVSVLNSDAKVFVPRKKAPIGIYVASVILIFIFIPTILVSSFPEYYWKALY